MRDDVRTVVVGDGWEIDVPASFEEAREENNALVLWDDRRTIRIRTLSVGGGRDGPISAEEMAGEEGASYRVERGDDVILELPPQRPETIEEEEVWTVPARAAAENTVTLVYFHSRSPDDEHWARSTAMSIRHSR